MSGRRLAGGRGDDTPLPTTLPEEDANIVQLEPSYAYNSLCAIINNTPRSKWPFRAADVQRVLVGYVGSQGATVYWVAALEHGRFALVRVRTDTGLAPEYHVSVTTYPTLERLVARLDDWVRANGHPQHDADGLHAALGGRDVAVGVGLRLVVPVLEGDSCPIAEIA